MPPETILGHLTTYSAARYTQTIQITVTESKCTWQNCTLTHELKTLPQLSAPGKNHGCDINIKRTFVQLSHTYAQMYIFVLIWMQHTKEVCIQKNAAESNEWFGIKSLSNPIVIIKCFEFCRPYGTNNAMHFGWTTFCPGFANDALFLWHTNYAIYKLNNVTLWFAIMDSINLNEVEKKINKQRHSKRDQSILDDKSIIWLRPLFHV